MEKVLINLSTSTENDLFHNLQGFYENDSFITRLLSGEQKYIKAPHGQYQMLNNIVYYVDKDEKYLLNIPPNAVYENKNLRQMLLQEAHDSLYSGHVGSAKTGHRILQQFYWPNIRLDVEDYCKSCVNCQRNKPTNRKPIGLCQPLEVAWVPWGTVSMDFITQLPKSVDGFDSVFVVMDQLSKRAHFIPTTSDVTADQVAHLFFNNIWKLHGLPHSIISDRDSKFTSDFWKTLWLLLGTKLKMSTAYSPQTDGQTERINRTLEEYIRAYIDPQVGNWAQLLAPAEYAYNTHYHESIKATPFEIDCGRNPSDPMFMFASAAKKHAGGNKIINSLDDFLHQMRQSWDMARTALEQAQQYRKKYYDKNHRDEKFQPGEQVFMSSRRERDSKMVRWGSKSPEMSNKFEPRFLGPFKIIRKFLKLHMN